MTIDIERFTATASKYAALQGYVANAQMLSRAEVSRLVASGLTSIDIIQHIWSQNFNHSYAKQIRHDQIHARDFPLLWFDTDGDSMQLFSGINAAGQFIGVASDDSEELIDSVEVATGTLLQLNVTDDAKPRQRLSILTALKEALKKRSNPIKDAIIATLVLNTLGLFTAFYTMQVYDRVIPTKGFSTLLVLTVGVAIAILFEYLLRQTRANIMERCARGVDVDISSILISKVLAIRLDTRPSSVGSFVSQIRQFESIRGLLATSVLFVLADLPFAIVFIAVIAYIGGILAIVPMITVPLAIFVALVLRRQVDQYILENITESNQKNGLLFEVIDGIEALKSSGGSWRLEDRYNKLTESIAENDLNQRMVSARAINFSMLIQQFNHVGLIGLGAYLVTQGTLTLGGLIACAILMGRIFTPLSQIPNLVVQWKMAQIAMEGLDKVMQLPEQRDQATQLIIPTSTQGRLQAIDISFAYAGEHDVLQVDQLSIRADERIAVIGAVGSGKSTLLKLLAGLYQPNSGQILYDDIDIQQIAPDYVREQLAYLPQQARLFSGSLRDNLTLGLPSIDDSTILAACKKTGLDHAIKSHPRGLLLPITEGGRGLSGGQRQQTALTKLILTQPKVLLLDEPTESIDTSNEQNIMQELLSGSLASCCLIMSTHKPALLKYFDRIIVLDQGRIIIDGSRDQVVQKIRDIQK